MIAGRSIDGPVTLDSPEAEPQLLSELAEKTFDWVDYQCSCPNCGAEVTGFRTRDLCNLFDTVDYRITNHFYTTCACGTCIDFIRKRAKGIEDFAGHVEQL